MALRSSTRRAGRLRGRWPWRCSLGLSVPVLFILVILALSRAMSWAVLSEAAALFPPSPEEIRLSGGRSALFLPGGSTGRLLIFLHSGGGSARRALDNSGFVTAARRAGLGLAFGDSRDGLWRHKGLREEDDQSDEDYLLELRETLLARGDGSRGVFLAGFSNGGMIALQAACDHPALFQGVALISSAMPAAIGESCRTLPARVVAVSGEADAVAPIDGGEGVNPQIGPLWGLDRLGEALLRRRRCVRFDRLRVDETSAAAPSVVLLRAAGCEQAGITDLYRVVGGGHDGYGYESWRLRLFGPGRLFLAPALIARAFAGRADGGEPD